MFIMILLFLGERMPVTKPGLDLLDLNAGKRVRPEIATMRHYSVMGEDPISGARYADKSIVNLAPEKHSLAIVASAPTQLNPRG
jgi:hypothetical protein